MNVYHMQLEEADQWLYDLMANGRCRVIVGGELGPSEVTATLERYDNGWVEVDSGVGDTPLDAMRDLMERATAAPSTSRAVADG